jgi:hypothetical protein
LDYIVGSSITICRDEYDDIQIIVWIKFLITVNLVVYVYHKIGHCFKSCFSIITFKKILSIHMSLMKLRFKHDIHENFTWHVKISHMLFSQIQGRPAWIGLRGQLLPIIQVLANYNYNLSESSSALHNTRNWNPVNNP